MKHCKKIQAHMLPTEDATHIAKYNTFSKDEIEFSLNKEQGDTITNQHLYITDDSEIKNNNWVYDTLGGKIIQWYDIGNHDKHDKKIIASTDPKLIVNLAQNGNDSKSSVLTNCYNMQQLPQPSQEFIKLFCELGGKGEWEVEYENIPIYTGDGCHDDNYRFKVNPDNTINITLVEQKVYTKAELLSKVRDAFTAGHRRGYSQRSIIAGFQGTNELSQEEWINKNI